MRKLAVLALLAMATLAGCVADDSSGDQDDNTLIAPADYVVPDVPHVDAVELLADHAAFVTEHNERAANKPTHESARVALMERFASYGLEVYRQNFTAGIPQANIIGIKWGLVRDEWVVVGGHYDTTTDDCLVSTIPVVDQPNPCPLRALSQGAYDDGSGTMMTVHLGKAFANVTPYYTMAFVGYDGEERGTQGAAAFVNAFVTGGEEGDNFTTPYGRITVRGAVDLDMIGLNWPGVMAPINVIDNSNATYAAADNARRAMGWPDAQWARKDGLLLGSSDYARFWEVTEEQGGPIPTIFFISDFEELGVPNTTGEIPEEAHTPMGAYPFWHLQDTVETMTAMAGGQDNLVAGFQSSVDVATAVLHALACQPTMEFDAVAK
ncbi:MAG: M28 family peptidase [Candidatus Thermoplasmatota archaeon]